ncbi:MAG: hypothetical protein ACNA8W_26410, partial [Bradymonadaceae bacterium]
PEQRYILIQRFFSRLGKSRPVVLWLNDVHWGSDSIGLAKYLLEFSHEAMPVLIVMTARDDVAGDAQSVHEILESLQESEHLRRNSIGPLGDDDCHEFIHELLFLDDDLAIELARRSAGNPLFAVQLMGDWVDRGLLEVGEEGFRLREGAATHFPDDLFEIWTEPLEHLLGPRPFEDTLALELAAALGQHVDRAEWRAVCATAELAVPDDLIELMIARRLAYVNETGWSLAHVMLREALVRTAQVHNRWRGHNRECGLTLEAMFGDDPMGAERRGYHLIEAQEYEQALNPLYEAASFRRRVGELDVAAHLLSLRERAMGQIALPADDRRWATGDLLLSMIHLNRGKPRLAEAVAKKGLEAALFHGWRDIIADAYLRLGHA